MIRPLVFLYFFTLILVAKELPFRLLSSNIVASDEFVIAKGGIEAYYKDLYIKAKYLKYNKKNQVIEFFGGVEIIKGLSEYIKTKYLKLDISKDIYSLKPVFLKNKTTNIWFATKEIQVDQKKDYYVFDKATLSSCAPEDPEWKIYYSSGEYYNKSQWLVLYNARLHLFGIPIFYFPYIGFPLDTTRRSGLLKPKLGYSYKEGALYKQSIFIAPYKNWDITISPEIRGRRGEGVYGSIRYKDTKDSMLNINFGYFEDTQKYVDEYDYLHKIHTGIDINYEKEKKLDTFNLNEGIYLDLHYLTDIDYINLQSDDSTNFTVATLVPSYFNYLLNNDKYYLGIYGKYYINVQQKDNYETLQQLPQVQTHKYLDSFFGSDILYSFDSSSKRHYRKKGLNAFENSINIPISYTLPLFNNFLHLSYEELISYKDISLSHSDIDYPDTLNHKVSGRHKVELSSDLIKAYDDNIHSMLLSVNYVKPEQYDEKGLYRTLKETNTCKLGAACEFLTTTKIQETLNLSVSNFLLDQEGKEFFYQNLKQSYFLEQEGDKKLGELTNEFRFNIFKYYTVYNTITYNYRLKRSSKILSNIDYKGKKTTIHIGHVYEYGDIKESNYLNTSLNFKYNERYQYFGSYQYDLEENKSFNWSAGWSLDKRCRDYKLTINSQTKPILTSSGVSYIRDRIIYFQIGFKPFIQLEFEHEIEEDKE